MTHERTPEEAELQMLILQDTAHEAAKDHLEACYDYLLTGAPAPAGMEPFDGCTDCQVRETLRAAWPYMAELAILEEEEQFTI